MAEPPVLTDEDAAAWFAEQVPAGWFSSVRAVVDRDEIMIIGRLAHDDTEPSDDAPGDEQAAAASAAADGANDHAELSRIEWFREETRSDRVGIAQRAEAKFRRKVSWATSCGSTQVAFTHLNVPVMTRLRVNERQILDTLVAGGVARSRSDALAWCVRLVAQHEGDWLDELRTAISAVDEIRAQGPS